MQGIKKLRNKNDEYRIETACKQGHILSGQTLSNSDTRPADGLVLQPWRALEGKALIDMVPWIDKQNIPVTVIKSIDPGTWIMLGHV